MEEAIKKDVNYLEGVWVAKKLADNIEKTEYGTIEEFITAKQSLIEHFEKEFGYSRDDESFDRNYSFNYGLLDKLRDIKSEKDKV